MSYESGKAPEWTEIARPGYLGKHRDEKFKAWDDHYGKGKWRFMWKVEDLWVDFAAACMLYEDAYLVFLDDHSEIVEQLVNEASDVYDDEPSNVASGFDYAKQETKRTHVQDIAIRRCLLRIGKWFKGNKLIRIRQEKGDHPLSMILSPGKVPFHRPEIIVQPEIHPKWADSSSVESFYQSNRYLQIQTVL